MGKNIKEPALSETNIGAVFGKAVGITQFWGSKHCKYAGEMSHIFIESVWHV